MKLRKAIFEMRFKPNLAFFPRMDAIGVHLSKDYEDWITNRHSIGLYDKKNRAKILIESGRIACEMDDPHDPEAFFTRVARGLKCYLSEISVNEATRIGTRFKFLKALDFNFEEIVEVMQEKIFHAELSTALSFRYEDLALIVYLREKDFKIHLQSGPLKKNEIIQRLAPAFQEEFDEDSEPDISLLVDVDCIRENAKATEADSIIREADKLTRALADSYAEYILGANR